MPEKKKNVKKKKPKKKVKKKAKAKKEEKKIHVTATPETAASEAETETKVAETKVAETKVEETKVEETKVEETKVEETKVEEIKVDETVYAGIKNSDAFALGWSAGRTNCLEIPYVTPSWTEMTKDKGHFITFLKSAIDPTTPEFLELYKYLLMCFTNADANFDGTVCSNEFLKMLEIAAAAPRTFGFAPTTKEMEERLGVEVLKLQRFKLFQGMCKPGQDTIAFDAWLKYAFGHIKEKVDGLEVTVSGYKKDGQDFIDFYKLALKKGSPESKELYRFLLDAFSGVDLDHDGIIGPYEFDQLLVRSNCYLKQFGFPTHLKGLERIEVNGKIFKAMDKNQNGMISFDEWLEYIHKHLCDKIAAL